MWGDATGRNFGDLLNLNDTNNQSSTAEYQLVEQCTHNESELPPCRNGYWNGCFYRYDAISLHLRMVYQSRKLTGIAIRILHLPTSITRQTIRNREFPGVYRRSHPIVKIIPYADIASLLEEIKRQDNHPHIQKRRTPRYPRHQLPRMTLNLLENKHKSNILAIMQTAS